MKKIYLTPQVTAQMVKLMSQLCISEPDAGEYPGSNSGGLGAPGRLYI